jgi:hypothetical protein
MKSVVDGQLEPLEGGDVQKTSERNVLIAPPTKDGSLGCNLCSISRACTSMWCHNTYGQTHQKEMPQFRVSKQVDHAPFLAVNEIPAQETRESY